MVPLVLRLMIPIAVYALHYQISRIGNRLGIAEERAWRIAEVAGEDNFFAIVGKLDHRRSEHMAGIFQKNRESSADSGRGMIFNRLPILKRIYNIADSIQRLELFPKSI